MKILITGGTGLIGKELGKTLVRKGHSIVLLTRNTDQAKQNCPFPHISFQWQGDTDVPPLECFESIDAIINLAGEPIAGKRWTDKYKMTLKDSRIRLTANLLQGLDLSGVNPAVYLGASAIGFYADSADTWLEESQTSKCGFLQELTHTWEKAQLELKNGQPGIRQCLVRIGVVLSEKGGALDKMLPLLRTGLGGALGSGKQYMSWIDIDDLISIFCFLLENPEAKGIYNGVAPEPVTNLELTKTITSHLGVWRGPTAPGLVLKIILGEMATMLLASQRVSAVKVQKIGYEFKCHKLQESLNLRIPKPSR